MIGQRTAALILVLLAGGSNVLRDLFFCIVLWRMPWALPRFA